MNLGIRELSCARERKTWGRGGVWGGGVGGGC